LVSAGVTKVAEEPTTVPEQDGPEYQANDEIDPEPPDGTATREAAWPESKVTGEAETSNWGLTATWMVVWAVPSSESAAWTQNMLEDDSGFVV
jgi:hypothetical protein